MIFIGCYAMYDLYSIDESAKLDDDILIFKPKETETSDSFSLDDLKIINDNIVGWVTIDDTNIDYPILYADDNSKYLDLDYRDEFSTAGSIFLDYRNENFTDDYSIIYGHHMSNELMFSDITKFNDLDYFNSHITGKLYSENGVYDLFIYSYAVVNAFNDTLYDLNIYKNNNNDLILNSIRDISTFKRDYNYNNEKILLLSTCNAEMKNDREVLLAIMSLNNVDANYIEKNNKDIKNDNFNKVSINKEHKKEYRERINIFSRNGVIVLLFLFVIIIYIILFLKLRKKKDK